MESGIQREYDDMKVVLVVYFHQYDIIMFFVCLKSDSQSQVTSEHFMYLI